MTGNGVSIPPDATRKLKTMNNRKLLSVSLTILLAVALLALVAPAVSAQDQGEGNIVTSLELVDGEAQTGEVQTYNSILQNSDGEVGTNAGHTVNISLEPASITSGPGGVNTYDVVVSGATEGISGYDNIEVEIQDPAVANFTDFNETATANEGDQSIFSITEIRDANDDAADEGPTIFFSAGLADKGFEGAEEITIATVDVTATGSVGDQTSVDVLETDSEGDAPVLQNASGGEYPTGDLSGSTFEISFDMSLEFNDQEVQPGDTVTVENVESDGEPAAVVVTYPGESGLVIAGLSTGTYAGDDVAVELGNFSGFTGEDPRSGQHTAHIIPVSQLSQDYGVDDIVSSQTAGAIIDAETATVTDPALPDLDGLDIVISEGLTIGDDYPLNFNNLGGDVYGPTSPINTPTAVDARYAPFIQGQHVGITGLPVQTDTYEWVADQGLLGSSTASQIVDASFDASVGSASLGYSQSVAHGLAPADLRVAAVEGIDRADLNLDIGASGVDITYDPADAVADDIQVQFELEWEAADSVEGLDVDANNNIDFGTAHRLQQGNERVSDTFVTFETGTTGISNEDAVAPSNFDSGFPEASLDGPTAFQVRQNQLVTFEVADNEDALAVYEYQTDNNGNIVLEDGNQLDPNQISFDQTEPGQVANLNTGDLSPGDYVVEFQNSGDVVGLQVLELNLGADTPANTQRGEFVSLPVSADSSAEGNDVEAYFYEAGTSGLGNVIHVERDQLGGDGDALLDDVSTTADLNAAVGDEFYAVVRHLDSGVTTQTGTFEVVDQTPDLIPADEVNIVSPSLESPDIPGRFDRGDVIPIELELEGGNVATITFGDAEEQNIEVTATVYDPTFSAGEEETTVNLFLSTYHIGHGYVANGSVDDLELNTPQNWNTPGVADNRNHGFIAPPDDPTSALLPAERLDREHNVFAEGSIDISGGSQGGAVLSPDPGYDLHATGGDLPYTLIGDDRDDERDDVNFLTVDDRSTQDFRFWTAPGEGNAAINIGPGTTAEDIENLVDQGLISELETETVTETDANGTEFERIRFNGQVAEGDFLIVQAQATGLEGPLLEAELRQNPSGTNIQDLIDTITGAADDGVITSEFLNATSEIVPDSELGDEPNNRLLDYRFNLIENQTSYQQRIAEPEPNEELLVPNRINPDLAVSSVVANLNADNTPSDFYVPYKVGVDLPVPTGANTDTETLTFDSSAILEPRGGTQPSVPTSVNPLLTVDSVGLQTVDELGYVPAQVSIDSQHTGQSGLEVPRVDEYTITGTSTMASGTTVDIVLLSETDEATPFLKTREGVELTAQDDSPLSAFEATFDFSETRDNVEIVGGTAFEADITRAGVGAVAGGEDILGLVLNDPAIETFTLNNQRSDGDVVTIAAYEANRDSQITVQDADGNVLGTSDVLPRGQVQEQFNIELDQAINSNQQVTAVAEIIKPEAGDELASETAEVLVEEQQEAFFGVSDLSPTNGQVEQGTTVTAEATVENLGDLEGTQSVTFSVVGTDISVSEEVTLAGGESTTVSFDLPTGDVPANSYTHQIASEDDTVTGGLTVQAPPAPAAFEIVSLSPADASVTQGDELVVDVSVQNTGEQEGTQDVVLSVSGLGDVGTQSLTLAGGAADSVSFTVDTTEVDAGDYTHSVSVGDASDEGSLTIMEPMPDSPDNGTDNGTDNASSDDGSGPGFGIVVAALALLGAALLAMRRQVE